MNQELTKKLFDNYPSLFIDKDKPPTQSLLCFGFECGDGWYPIIDALCSVITRHATRYNMDIKAVQVKEKFAELRFYINSGDDIIWHLIDFATEMSTRTCMRCGNTKTAVLRDEGWWVTLCDECCEKDKKK